MAASVVLSTTSATSIMLAALNDISSLPQSSSDSHSHSLVGSVLPPLICDKQEDLPESSRQSITTQNKFVAVDVISHKYAWLFHLIDRNSDASLTLSEFIAALADQPLVSMALDLPQQMTEEGSYERVEQLFDFMDYNGSGTINMRKFLQYIDNLRREESIKLLRDTKKKLDAMKAEQSQIDSRPVSANSAAFKMDYVMAMGSRRRLNLTSRCIEDQHLPAMGKNLSCNTMLRFLVLSRNNIGVEGVSEIAMALRTNTTLTRLDLGSNKFGDEGVILIAESLHRNSTLQRLDLYNTPMKTSGARAIAKSIMINKTLRELSLRGNYMGNDGAMLIGESLRYNQTLTCLFLQENNIDPLPGMRGVVTSLYSIDNFVLEKLEGIDLVAFCRILDIIPGPSGLTNKKVLAIMRKRRGLQVSKWIKNK